jgi:hypothetical protein
VPVSSVMALPVRGCGNRTMDHHVCHRVTKLLRRRSVLERRAIVGKGPVSETYAASERVSRVAPGPSKLA